MTRGKLSKRFVLRKHVEGETRCTRMTTTASDDILIVFGHQYRMPRESGVYYEVWDTVNKEVVLNP